MIRIVKVGATGRFLRILVLLLPLVLIASLFAGCGGGVTEKPTVPAPQEAETPPPVPEEPTPTPEPSTVSLKILSHSSYISYKSYVSWPSGKRYKGHFFHIVGEFQNPSSVNVRLDEDKIEATFYDAGGSTIDADFILKHRFAEEEMLAPGEKWPFRLSLVDEEASKRVASYELLARGHETTEVPHQAKLLSYGLFQNANLKLIGEVKNTTDENVGIRVIAIFYDEKGMVIAAGAFAISIRGGLNCLAPGEKSPFKLVPIPKEAPGEIESCELLARWTISDTVPYREFEILNPVGETEPGAGGTWYRIKGEVQNLGNQRVTVVVVSATFYDTEEKIVACGRSLTEPSELGPGDKGTFDLLAGPMPPEATTNYVLQVDCWPPEKE